MKYNMLQAGVGYQHLCTFCDLFASFCVIKFWLHFFPNTRFINHFWCFARKFLLGMINISWFKPNFAHETTDEKIEVFTWKPDCTTLLSYLLSIFQSRHLHRWSCENCCMDAIEKPQFSIGFSDIEVYQNLSKIVMLLIEKTFVASQYQLLNSTLFVTL